jgi:serine/threonine-protein kinase
VIAGRFEILAPLGVGGMGIVDLYDVIDSEGGLYLVIDFVDGETLEEIVASRGRLAASECARLFKAIGSAISCAHGRGIAHLDIKPSNLMRDRAGKIKVLDFGLARHVADSGNDGECEGAGTPAYMAPEQYEGRPGLSSDIFSLGATLYELLTGTIPFKGKRADELNLAKRAQAYAALPDDVPAGLKLLVSSCLRADPAARPQSIAEALALVPG